MGRMLIALAAAAIIIPGVAVAAEGAGAEYVGSLEFAMGFGDSTEIKPDKGDTIEADMGTTLAIIPAIDQQLGKSVAIGGEYMFVWAKGDSDDAERRLIMSPHLRARMSFQVAPKATFDAMLGIGPSIWTSDDSNDGAGGDTRFGWSLRFGFGGSYLLNDQIAVFGQLGYYTTTSYGDDVEINVNTIPVGVGLRSRF